MTVQNFGTALGDGFVLNEATLMIGPLGSAMDLTEEKHSFGLFKNMAIARAARFPCIMKSLQQAPAIEMCHLHKASTSRQTSSHSINRL